jgi:hypothetical protein
MKALPLFGSHGSIGGGGTGCSSSSNGCGGSSALAHVPARAAVPAPPSFGFHSDSSSGRPSSFRSDGHERCCCGGGSEAADSGGGEGGGGSGGGPSLRRRVCSLSGLGGLSSGAGARGGGGRALLGSYEELLFSGRMLELGSNTGVKGFVGKLGASGVGAGKAPAQVTVPMTASFYHVPGESVGHLSRRSSCVLPPRHCRRCTKMWCCHLGCVAFLWLRNVWTVGRADRGIPCQFTCIAAF